MREAANRLTHLSTVLQAQQAEGDDLGNVYRFHTAIDGAISLRQGCRVAGGSAMGEKVSEELMLFES